MCRRRFVLDFRECGYIDSSGLGALLSVTNAVNKAGGWLTLAEMNEDLVTLLELSHMDEVLSIADRVIDALAWFGPSTRTTFEENRL